MYTIYIHFTPSADSFSKDIQILKKCQSRLRLDALGTIALDGTTLRARISVQDYWPKNVQPSQKIGDD